MNIDYIRLKILLKNSFQKKSEVFPEKSGEFQYIIQFMCFHVYSFSFNEH